MLTARQAADGWLPWPLALGSGAAVVAGVLAVMAMRRSSASVEA